MHSLSFSISDWLLNIDGLEIAEEPEMLSVLHRGQVWPTNSNEQRMVNTRWDRVVVGVEGLIHRVWFDAAVW